VTINPWDTYLLEVSHAKRIADSGEYGPDTDLYGRCYCCPTDQGACQYGREHNLRQPAVTTSRHHGAFLGPLTKVDRSDVASMGRSAAHHKERRLAYVRFTPESGHGAGIWASSPSQIIEGLFFAAWPSPLAAWPFM